MCIKLLCSLLGKVSRLLLFLQAKILLSKGKEHVFFEHIVDPSWNYKPYKKQINPYFAKYGFRYSMVECEYYKQMTGVESELYIPQTFFFYYLCPFLNKSGYRQDKNLFRKLHDVNNCKVKFMMPQQVVYNRGGIL